MEHEQDGPPIDRPQSLGDEELTQIGTLGLLSSLTAIGQTERTIVEVLITWGVTYSDSNELNDLDESILKALQVIRDDPDSAPTGS